VVNAAIVPGKDLFELYDYVAFSLNLLGTSQLNIRANTDPSIVGSVVFGYDGNANYRIESTAPYTLAANSGQNYFSFTPTIGTHNLTATIYSGTGGTGVACDSVTIHFTRLANTEEVDNPNVNLQSTSSNDGNSGSSSAAIIAGVVGGLAVLAVLVAVVVVLVRRKRQQESYELHWDDERGSADSHNNETQSRHGDAASLHSVNCV
jgi:hypothetical protein